MKLTNKNARKLNRYELTTKITVYLSAKNEEGAKRELYNFIHRAGRAEWNNPKSRILTAITMHRLPHCTTVKQLEF